MNKKHYGKGDFGIKNKKIYNKISGITLIALVITIIVLLILAGITVAQLSENNLFESAKIAKEKYQKAREQEDEIIGDYEDAITGDRGKKVNFSTEEQEIGTWINGKPLYQKTIDCGTLPNATSKDIATGFDMSKIRIVSESSMAVNMSTGAASPLTYVWADTKINYWLQPNGTLTLMATDNRTAMNAYITLQYIKLTD